jgi:hypothetical protein
MKFPWSCSAGSHSAEGLEPSTDPLFRVRRRLAPAAADWPPGGAGGPRRSTVGGSLCMRVDSAAPLQVALCAWNDLEVDMLLGHYL